MITVQYKTADGKWETDEATFHILDRAKAHTVSQGYPEYKAYNGDTLLVHLFNAGAKPKAVKKEEITSEDFFNDLNEDA